jgi:dipeptidyl aminopeptidase/acylaminoacyl peptidase
MRYPVRCLIALFLVVAASACNPRSFQPSGRPPYTAADLAQVTNIYEVAIAPVGDEIAYVSDSSGALELWTASRTNNGWQSRQKTALKEVVSAIAYGPNSDIVFCVDHGGDERNDLWLLRRNANKPELIAKTQTDEDSPSFSPDGRLLAFIADNKRPFRFNVMVRDIARGTVRALTDEPVNVIDPHWSRDSSMIVATVTPDSQKGDLVVIDVKSGNKRLIHPPRPDGILLPVDFLPDGQLLALSTNSQGFMQLATVDLRAGQSKFVGPGDWDVTQAVVAAAGGSVLIARNVHGESELLEFTGDWNRLNLIARGGVDGDVAISRDGSRRVILSENSTHSASVDLLERNTRATIVPPAMAAVDGARLGEARHEAVKSFDGRLIDTYVWKPPVSRLGTPPPAVVTVHGGPEDQSLAEFAPQQQALAEAGFVVLAPNYRGSSGYGREFLDLNNKDWGGGDLKDILAVVDHFSRQGIIDGKRVGIMGGSYGGYMTLRAITAAPQVWAAAVDLFGMPDLAEDYRITKDRFGSWYETEMGTPEADAALFRDRSPIHGLARVQAPLMVLQGENDTNVPKAESDLVVETLKMRGRPVEYVVYPNEGHGFTHRENRMDAMTRTVGFFVRYLGNPKR